MKWNLETIIVLLLLLDSIGAVLFAYTDGKKWYQKHFRVFSRWFPMAKGWPLAYLGVVLLFGWMLHRNGIIFLGA